MAARQLKGVLGTKLGMSQVFDDRGRMVPVTVVRAGPCVVTAVRTPQADGYSAVQLGYGEINPAKVNAPVAGHFRKAGVTPRRFLVELRTTDASEYTLGQQVKADVLEPGQRVGSDMASAGSARPTVPSASTERLGRSAAVPRLAGSSRACAWRGGWAMRAPPCRICLCIRWTRTAGCCSSRARSLARRAGSCSYEAR